MDPIYRAGLIDENIGAIDAKDVEDLMNLCSLIKLEMFKAREVCLLNPTFGEASTMVGGADADIVIDDLIIDIKTTKKLELKRDDYNQLVGYYALYKIGGIAGAQQNHQIRKLAIYFSRFGYLHCMEIENIIDHRSFPQFLLWLKGKVSEEYGQMRMT